MFEHQQFLGLCPKGDGVEIVRFHPVYGGTMTLPDDLTEYGFQPRQKWIPQIIEDTSHPAKIGDFVTLTDWLSDHIGGGMRIGIVSGVRTIKIDKRSNGTRQIELLGRPGVWSAIGHFEEYQGQQIFSHLWGNAFNVLPYDGLIVEEIKPRAQTRVILPNL